VIATSNKPSNIPWFGCLPKGDANISALEHGVDVYFQSHSDRGVGDAIQHRPSAIWSDLWHSQARRYVIYAVTALDARTLFDLSLSSAYSKADVEVTATELAM
jgi:hypothetical protein